jgi:uncharacterized protein GlcG (DUF336 family)
MSIATALVGSLLVTPLSAQTYVTDLDNLIETLPPSRSVERATGPTLEYALSLAKAVSDECAAQGGKASVLITDSVGEAVVLLSGDGAGVRAQVINITKVNAALRYKLSSGEVQDRAEHDPELANEIKANPRIGTVRRGAFLLFDGEEIIGAIAASGMGSGEANEACIQAAMARMSEG